MMRKIFDDFNDGLLWPTTVIPADAGIQEKQSTPLVPRVRSRCALLFGETDVFMFPGFPRARE